MQLAVEGEPFGDLAVGRGRSPGHVGRPRLWDEPSSGAVPATPGRICAAFWRDVIAEQCIMDVNEPVAELPVVRVPGEQEHRRDGNEDGAEDHADTC